MLIKFIIPNTNPNPDQSQKASPTGVREQDWLSLKPNCVTILSDTVCDDVFM